MYAGAIDLQVTYDTIVITAVRRGNVCLVHENRKTEVRFLRALHVASGNPSLNIIVRETYDWHLKRRFFLRYTLYHFNAIFNAMISYGSHDWEKP